MPFSPAPNVRFDPGIHNIRHVARVWSFGVHCRAGGVVRIGVDGVVGIRFHPRIQNVRKVALVRTNSLRGRTAVTRFLAIGLDAGSDTSVVAAPIRIRRCTEVMEFLPCFLQSIIDNDLVVSARLLRIFDLLLCLLQACFDSFLAICGTTAESLLQDLNRGGLQEYEARI